MKRVLSERDQLRALMLVAAACGANRIGSIVEGGSRHAFLIGFFRKGDWLVGAFLAAALLYRRDARLTTIVAAVTCAVGSVLNALNLAWLGSLVSSAGAGAFTVGAFAFVAELLVPDEEHLSAGRFAGMAAFVFARMATMTFGAMAWSGVPYDLSHQPLVRHGLGAAIALACVLAVVFALPPPPEDAPRPAQPVYRAPSPMEAPASPAPSAPRALWPMLRPFVAPAALFAFSTYAMGYRMGSTSINLFGGVTAAAGTIYFVRVWQRREAVCVVDWYARALVVAGAGWLLMGVGMFVGVAAYLGAIVASVGGAAAGLSLGFVAIAARGPRAGIALASWMLLASIASASSEYFAYAGVLQLFAAFASFLIARGLQRHARLLEDRL